MGIYLWRRHYLTRLKAPLPEGKQQFTDERGRPEFFTVLPGGKVIQSDYGSVSGVELRFEPAPEGSTVLALIRPGFMLFVISLFLSIPVVFIARLFFIFSDQAYQNNHSFFVALFFAIFIVLSFLFSLFIVNNGESLLEDLEYSWAGIDQKDLEPLGAGIIKYGSSTAAGISDIPAAPTDCPLETRELGNGGHELIFPRKKFTLETGLKLAIIILAPPIVIYTGCFSMFAVSSLFSHDEQSLSVSIHNAFYNLTLMAIPFSIIVSSMFMVQFASDYLCSARITVFDGVVSVESSEVFRKKKWSYASEKIGSWRLLGGYNNYKLHAPVTGAEDISIYLPGYSSPYVGWALKAIETWTK